MPRTDVLFLQRDPRRLMGLMYISSYLKKRGITADLLIDGMEINNLRKIKEINPLVIGISLTSIEIEWFRKVVKDIRRVSTAKIVVGGPHAIICPEMIEDEELDAICTGEGEMPLFNYVTALKNNKNTTKIRGFWVKENQKVTRNNLSMPINLNSLEYPDISLYSKYYNQMDCPEYKIFTGRGCPYACPYCINNTLKRLFGNGFFRRRPVPEVMKELRFIVRRYKPQLIFFLDETITYDIKWFKQLLKAYSKEFQTPFNCLVRPENLDAQIIGLMRKAGCRAVELGIESPFPKTREKILHRFIAQKRLIQVIRELNRQGIKVKAYNMVGLNKNWLSEFRATLRINHKAGVDFPIVQVITYFPKLEITNSFNHIHLGDDFKEKGNKGLEKIVYLTYLFYSFPWLVKYSKVISKLSLIALNKIIFLIHFNIYIRRYYGYSAGYYAKSLKSQMRLAMIKRAKKITQMFSR